MYFLSRFGGLRNRRVLETHSKSLEEAPSYYRDHDSGSVREPGLCDQEWEHRSWCGGWSGQEMEHHVSGHQLQHQPAGHHNHRRLPQTPRRPSTLLNMSGVSSLGLPPPPGPQNNINGQSLLNQQNIQQHNLQNQQQHHNQPPLNQKSTQSATSGSIFDKVSSFKQNLLPSLTQNLGGSLPAGTPLSFGVNSNLTVKSERNDRDQFTRSGVNPSFVKSMMNGISQQNGTYSSHPNLPTTQTKTQAPCNGALVGGQPNGGLKQHRQLPAVPKQPSALKLVNWRQSSLPEQRNPPGYDDHDITDLTPGPPLQHSGVPRRLKPSTPTKPSTLSLRQSTSHMNGIHNYNGAHPYQMPKLNCSPSAAFLNGVAGRTQDTMVHFNGVTSSQHRTLPPFIDQRRTQLSLGRSLPLPPPPPPAPPSPARAKQNGGFNGLSGMFHRSSQDVDWI